MANVDKRTRIDALNRSNGQCERCYTSLASNLFTSLHHRTPRGMGGSVKKELNYLGNLIYLCGSGTTGCHGWVEFNRELAREQGLLLFRSQNPEEVPFTDIFGVQWIIKNDGTKSTIVAKLG